MTKIYQNAFFELMINSRFKYQRFEDFDLDQRER